MKTYILYIDGIEQPRSAWIKASGHNAAEKKAQAKNPGKQVSVAYTEVEYMTAPIQQEYCIRHGYGPFWLSEGGLVCWECQFPDDYEACGTCGYDHAYEPQEAHQCHHPMLPGMEDNCNGECENTQGDSP